MLKLGWSVWGALFVVATICGCTQKDKDESPSVDHELDRKVLLVSIADEIIMPAYDQFAPELDTLMNKADLFTTTPNETTLDSLRAAWASAYIGWQKVELFDVGPANDQQLRIYFNIYPIDTTRIEERINGGGTDLSLTLGPDNQVKFILGFPSLDYLLYGYGDTQQTLAKYTTADDASKRIVFLKGVIAKMKTMFTGVHNTWKNGYRDSFVSSTDVKVNSSFALLINGYVLNYERYIRSGKIGIPSGAMMDGVVIASKVEAFYRKDLSLILAKTAQQASENFYYGKSTSNGQLNTSLRGYLLALNAKDQLAKQPLVPQIDSQFTAVSSRLNELHPNFAEEVLNNNQAMINTFAEMQKLVRLLKVDMTSAISVGITYLDTDGD
jgi:predicted lipoprotein